MALLEIKSVSKSFTGLQALNDVSLSLESGAVGGLIGPNGAGKTTLFNVITGFLPPDTGVVRYDGREITGLPPYRVVHAGVVRSWQAVRLFYGMSVLDNVIMAIPGHPGENVFLSLFAIRRVKRAETELRKKAMAYLEFVNLAHAAKELAKNLSYPEQKLLSIARLMATEGKLLLLDEPMSGMDTSSVEKSMFPLIRRLVAEQGKTILIVEHNLDVVKGLCDTVFFLHHGALIAQGTPQEVMSSKELGDIYFGT